ncbi:hypothetical protein JS84_07700 [Vibrio vulnificus]|uniref:hypothetical protein n=1 Tax=Vibrio vulnificus TaxID=672 RepID=UPI000348FC70|nr:hypothetical protein [Vibrio vulnificus]EWS70345.1 hypothetical protein Y702_03605 [Vibrio vulnificus BAA87]KFK59585.1 hypothetical protein JS83_12400 [Vibrio vulnificus]KFK65172.1 hypothetical protein JS84_07700 [Vibrio vulnificus]KFK70212.1 hypothetical protein JS85_05080 [Vibrio vulnificus]KOR97268.1 hypothetical protein LO82_13610 [Vibrio vulnificus]
MSFGAVLYFDGYPEIDISNWKPFITMGSYFMSYSSTYKPEPPGHGEVVGEFQYPVNVPEEASVYVSGNAVWFGGRTWYSGKNGRVLPNADNRKASVGFYPFSAEGPDYLYGNCLSGVVYTAVADLTNVVSSASFGFTFTDQAGMDAAFNNLVPPLSVMSRRVIDVSATDSVVEYDLPEFNKDVRGAQELVVYVGTVDNAIGVYAQLVPKGYVNRKGFETGAILRCSFFPANSAHASVMNYNSSTAGVAGKLLILIAGKPTTTPAGYGIAIYNPIEKLTFAPNCVPVMPKAIAYNKAFSGPNVFVSSMLGSPDPLTGNLLSEDTILFPAGMNGKKGLSYKNGRDRIWYEGYAVTWINQGYVKTALLWLDTSNVYSENGQVQWVVYTNEWSSYLTRRDPIPLVRANDYFLNI